MKKIIGLLAAHEKKKAKNKNTILGATKPKPGCVITKTKFHIEIHFYVCVFCYFHSFSYSTVVNTHQNNRKFLVEHW